MKRLTMVTVLTIFFLLTSTFALGHQGRPLAKIRVDDSGNVEILEITGDANTSFSGQPLQQNQEKTKHINNPASPMSLPDLEFEIDQHFFRSGFETGSPGIFDCFPQVPIILNFWKSHLTSGSETPERIQQEHSL